MERMQDAQNPDAMEGQKAIDELSYADFCQRQEEIYTDIRSAVQGNHHVPSDTEARLLDLHYRNPAASQHWQKSLDRRG
jgi:hypothetical protein